MSKRRLAASILVAIVWLAFQPSDVSAQSAFAGVVTDNTGAVMPGVTVEAASPVLIEKVRTVVTDGQGRYTIVDLRPGTYQITFTLTGFNTLIRDGVELPADFTATVSVQLSVGSLQESVTVSGQSPMVDVQSSARTLVINRDLLDALPTPRNTQSFGYLAQGVRLSKPDVGGAQMMEQVNMRVHGASQLHTTMQVDGMLVSPAFNDGAIQNYWNQAAFGETAFTTSSQGAEVSAGGIRLNMIPRDGGNTFHGSLYMGVTDGSWQSNNLTDELRAKGLSLPTGITNIHDVNPSLGGPILQDKLWFFASMRFQSVDEKVVNAYMPDGSQAIVDQYVRIPHVRLTYQATPKNKLSAFLDRPFKYKGREFTFGHRAVTRIPPPQPGRSQLPQCRRQAHVGDQQPVSVRARLHADRRAAAHAGISRRNSRRPRGGPARTACAPARRRHARTTPATSRPARGTATSRIFDLISNQRTVATTGYAGTLPDRNHITTALSYVTGSHTFKTGFQWSFGQDRNDASAHGDINSSSIATGSRSRSS